MKKILFGIALILSQSAFGCDVCGGAVGSIGGDVVPGIFNNYFGFNTSFRGFSSTHLTLFESEEAMHSSELFAFGSIHGRYSPIRRLQFLVNVPFSAVRKEMNEEVQSVSGFSDVSLRTNFLAVDRVNDSLKKYTNVFIGGTVKVPTGRASFRDQEVSMFHRNMLPGSGAFDFSAHADVFLRRRNFGFVATNTVTFRGTVKNEYDYGNVFQSRISGFHLFEFPGSSLMLDLGAEVMLIGEDQDLIYNEVDKYTGGITVSPSLRVNYFWNSLVLNFQIQRPIYQNLASGQVKNEYAAQFGAIYLIKKKKK